MAGVALELLEAALQRRRSVTRHEVGVVVDAALELRDFERESGVGEDKEKEKDYAVHLPAPERASATETTTTTTASSTSTISPAAYAATTAGIDISRSDKCVSHPSLALCRASNRPSPAPSLTGVVIRIDADCEQDAHPFSPSRRPSGGAQEASGCHARQCGG